MINEISPKFIQFIKTIIKEGDISTRELSVAVGKSTSYISRILTGKIRTISFNTAFAIMLELNKKYPFAKDEESITDMLVHQFGIEPEEWIQQRIEQAEAEEMRRQEIVGRINSCIITNYNTSHLEHILEFCQLESNYDHILFDMIFSNIKKDNRILKILIHSLHDDEWGSLIQLSEKEKELTKKIQNIIKELSFNE